MENKSLLLRYLGDSPELRIIDFLMDNYLFDYSKKEIIEGSGIAKATFYKYWGNLEKEGIVAKTKEYGKTKLYTINKENPVVKELFKLERAIAESDSAKITVKVKAKQHK